MKARNFDVSLFVHEWNFSGLSSGKQTHLIYIHNFKPTVGNVRKLVNELFPEKEIDEQDMPLFEQIHESLDCGIFSVHLKEKDMFFARSVAFTEIF